MIETKYKNIYIDENSLDIYKLLKNGSYHKMSKFIDNLGYYMTAFRINGKKKYIRVHRIIAETLIPNPNNYPQINHIDNNKLNNNLDNLEWCSNAYNTQEAYDNGLYPKHRCCKIKAISKENGQSYEFNSIRECAKELKLNKKTITSILKGEKKNNNYNYYFQYI